VVLVSEAEVTLVAGLIGKFAQPGSTHRLNICLFSFNSPVCFQIQRGHAFAAICALIEQSASPTVPTVLVSECGLREASYLWKDILYQYLFTIGS
jgi:hypothetical protein